MSPLNGWENFYVIVGSSAGALIGLQFVVMTLIANQPLGQSDARAGHAFGTPTIVHFGVVLLLSATASAPWDGLTAMAIIWGLVGLSGIVCTLLVVRHMRLQTVYQPVLEDLLFHILLPLMTYAMLIVAASSASSHPRPSMFLVGTVALLLLFIGIHNAWDAVMYHVFVKKQNQ